jgi:hypothetical protein
MPNQSNHYRAAEELIAKLEQPTGPGRTFGTHIAALVHALLALAPDDVRLASEQARARKADREEALAAEVICKWCLQPITAQGPRPDWVAEDPRYPALYCPAIQAGKGERTLPLHQPATAEDHARWARAEAGDDQALDALAGERAPVPDVSDHPAWCGSHDPHRPHEVHGGYECPGVPAGGGTDEQR